MTIRSIVVVVVLGLASGCGGADTTTSDAPPPGTGATTAPETSTPAADGAATSTSTTGPTPPTITEPTSTMVVDVAEATPWAIVLAEPTGPRLHDWTAEATPRPPAPDPPDGVDAALAWIDAGLIELWRADRLVALPMSDVALGSSHREVVPGAAIDIVGSGAALLADSYSLIAERASAAAVPGSSGELLFAAWSEYATAMAVATEHVRSVLVEARSLSTEDQTCFLTVLDGEDGCTGPGADLAAALLGDAEASAAAVDELEIEDLGTYKAFGIELDECAAWDEAAAATGLTDDEEARIWLAIDDHELDVTFVGRSECHWERDGVEDAAIDELADRAAFADYLRAVARAVVETGYDEASAALGAGAEDERREYEYRSGAATTEVVDVAREIASRTWAVVGDPVLATTLYEVTDLDFADWAELGLYELAWGDVAACDVWTEVLDELASELDDAETSVFEVTVSELGIEGSLVPDGCD